MSATRVPAGVPDLRKGPPRRWCEELDGIVWLPRLIDKTRAALEGTLGDYLFGQSPMDRALLRKLQLSHRAFAAIVQAEPDDAGVLRALLAADRQRVDLARRWSAGLARRHRLFFWFIDVDDGYRRAPAFRGAIALAAAGLSRAAKRLWPLRRNG